MIRVIKSIFLLLLLILNCQTNSYAELIDRGGGLIYDTIWNITYLQDFNHAYTSGYSSSSGSAFTDGHMNWAEAMTWAESLTYQGYDDWRLPTGLFIDGTGPCQGGNCYKSEMLHLFTDEGITKVNPGPFINIQSYYWSKTEYPLDPAIAKSFTFSGGYGNTIKSSYLFAMAVRNGDSTPVAPEPISSVLFIAGGASIGLRNYIRKKRT